MNRKITERLLEMYIESYVDIYLNRQKCLLRSSWDIRQIELLEGFCELTGKSFKFALEHIAKIGKLRIEEGIHAKL